MTSNEPNGSRRARRGGQVVAGYPSGQNATEAAMAPALVLAQDARSVVLVEGVSDQIALETLAARCERDLPEEGIVVVPIGGAQAVAKFLRRFDENTHVPTVGGLCDVGEVKHFAKALKDAGLVEGEDRADLERAGFFVCDKDLEDELLRAVGRDGIEAVLASEGELRSFRTMQNQPAWRDAPFASQVRRFLGARAGRKHRYAQLLVLALDCDRVPEPLRAVLKTPER